MEKAIPPTTATQNYNIGDGEGADAGEGGRDECDGSEWSESHELRDGAGNAGQGAAAAHGTAAAAERSGDWGQDHSMGTGDWWDMPYDNWGAGVRWEACGHGKWTRASWADSWEREHGDGGTDASHPPSARRRLEPAAPKAAARGEAAATDEAADAAARKQQHTERAQKIVLATIDAGIQPLTATGEELHVRDPHQLDAWVAENPHNDMQYWWLA